MEEEKEKRLSAKLKKLKRIFKNIPKDRKELCMSLIQNAAFMELTLEDLQETVNEEGAVVTLKNGNGFDIMQEHPAQKSYNTMISKYAAVIKQLEGLLPEQEKEVKNNLLDWIKQN